MLDFLQVIWYTLAVKSRILKPDKVKKKYILAAVVLAIGLYAVFGDKGLVDVYKLKRERDGILAFNAALVEENGKLEREIGLLNNDTRYAGYIARKELGMIGKNEVVYRFANAR